MGASQLRAYMCRPFVEHGHSLLLLESKTTCQRSSISP
jgi:hypothetical protein